MTADERRQDKRRRLHEAALELFAGSGFANTSIDALCQHAAMSLRTFYEQYRSKEELFVDLYDEQLDRLRTSVTEARDTARVRRDVVPAIARALVQALVDDPRVGRVMLVESGLVPEVDAHRRASHRLFAAFIDETFPEVAPLDGAALGGTGGIIELIADWLIHETAAPPDQLVERIETYAAVMVAGARAVGRRR